MDAHEHYLEAERLLKQAHEHSAGHAARSYFAIEAQAHLKAAEVWLALNPSRNMSPLGTAVWKQGETILVDKHVKHGSRVMIAGEWYAVDDMTYESATGRLTDFTVKENNVRYRVWVVQAIER